MKNYITIYIGMYKYSKSAIIQNNISILLFKNFLFVFEDSTDCK